MIGKKKTIAAILSAMMPLALAACSGTETSGANVHKETKKIETKGEASIPSEAEQLQKIAGEIGRALDADDMEQLKAAGQQLHDEWFSFEDEVRDKFPLLYTKVEKHLLPVYAQTTLKTPDVEQVKEHLPELEEALKALEHPQAAATSSGERAKLKEAVAKYKAYVEEQAGKLVESTETFVKAVKAEDLAAAKASYAEARVYYERIEPIAESFGELDPAIDARVNDVEDKANWTGFHRLEKAIWKDGTLDGQAKYADQLLNDVKQLHDKIEGVTLNAKQIVAGSMELLNEAATSKITGEEERYSHLDLVDLAANVHGSEAVYNAILPALKEQDEALAGKLEKAFDSFYEKLDQYKKENGAYVSYTKLSKDEVRKLSNKLSHLSELMAQTAKIFQ